MANVAVVVERFAGVKTSRPRLPPIETYPWALALAKTRFGKALFALAVAAALLPYEPAPLAFAVAAAAGACAVAGSHRPIVLTVATLSLLPVDRNWLVLTPVKMAGAREDAVGIDVIALAGTLFAMFVLFQCAVRLRDAAVFRRPILLALVLYSTLVVAASALPLAGFSQALLWSFIATFGGYFWFFSLSLIDAGRGSPPFYVRLGAFSAPWNWMTHVPFGKGVAYLRKFEAKDADQLAITQLKGIKLLAWAGIIKIFVIIFRRAIHDVLGLPTFEAAFHAQLVGLPLPVAICWLSLIAAFLENLLAMAAWGHLIVAIARIAGYRLLRNTCRPLSSRTIAEFWNRYYFYFKELLVDVFFYPTFLRCFRSYPRLRLAFATFMAAGFGNAIFHFMDEIRTVSQLGLTDAVIGYQTYAFYCIILSAGIIASQLRKHDARDRAGFVRSRLWPGLCVALFYCLLYIFDDVNRETTLTDHLRFLFHLFGVDLFGS